MTISLILAAIIFVLGVIRACLLRGVLPGHRYLDALKRMDLEQRAGHDETERQTRQTRQTFDGERAMQVWWQRWRARRRKARAKATIMRARLAGDKRGGYPSGTATLDQVKPPTQGVEPADRLAWVRCPKCGGPTVPDPRPHLVERGPTGPLEESRVEVVHHPGSRSCQNCGHRTVVSI